MAARRILWNFVGVRLTVCNVYPASLCKSVGDNLKLLHDRLQCGRFLCTCENDWLQESVKPKKKKTVPIPKITLVLPDQSIIVTDQESAEKISKRRNLNLIKSGYDVKAERPIYKLIKNSANLQGDIKQVSKAYGSKDNGVSNVKSQKVIQIKFTINEGHLLIKLKQVTKLLAKRHSVKFLIFHQGNNVVNINECIKKEIEGYGSITKTIEKDKQSTLLILPLEENMNVLEDNPDKSEDIKTEQS